jgi:hypothetical protein
LDPTSKDAPLIKQEHAVHVGQEPPTRTHGDLLGRSHPPFEHPLHPHAGSDDIPADVTARQDVEFPAQSHGPLEFTRDGEVAVTLDGPLDVESGGQEAAPVPHAQRFATNWVS